MAAQVQIQSADGFVALNSQQQPIIIFSTAAPTAGQKGVAPGCLYIRGGASPALYQNTAVTAEAGATWTANS